jgi:hypothetical protein
MPVGVAVGRGRVGVAVGRAVPIAGIVALAVATLVGARVGRAVGATIAVFVGVAATRVSVAVGRGTSVQCRQMMSGNSATVAVSRAFAVASMLVVGALTASVPAATGACSPAGLANVETSRALLAVRAAMPTSAASQTGICEKRMDHLTVREHTGRDPHRISRRSVPSASTTSQPIPTYTCHRRQRARRRNGASESCVRWARRIPFVCDIRLLASMAGYA